MNTRTAYMVGFVLSLITTLAAYDIALMYAQGTHTLARSVAVVVLVVLALTQCVVQMVCFLHLSLRREKEKTFLFFYTLAIVLLLIGGSLWIMTHLNDRMADSSQMYQYMNSQSGI